MTDSLTRTASLILAFGFFFTTACSIQMQTLDKVHQQYEDGEYEKALSTANEQLQEDPRNGQLLYLKAEILLHLAQRHEQPENRFDYYREMKSSLDQLRGSEAPDLITRRDSLIISTWSKEQGAGVRLLQKEDLTYSDEQLHPIISHFENAILVNPDSSSTYNLKATTYYRSGDVQNAVKTLQTAYAQLDSMPSNMSEKLAFLLLEEGHLPASIELYKELLHSNPENEEAKHGLVNVYILDEQHENSIRLLRELLDHDPENITYQQALATELFFHIEKSVLELSHGELENREISMRYERLLENLEEAEKLYHYVRENHPNPDEITFVTAAFYKNTANHLLNVAQAGDDDPAVSFREKARQLLSRSIPVWEAVAERNPENPEIWKSIYQIYSQLGMAEEAERAQAKANL